MPLYTERSKVLDKEKEKREKKKKRGNSYGLFGDEQELYDSSISCTPPKTKPSSI